MLLRWLVIASLLAHANVHADTPKDPYAPIHDRAGQISGAIFEGNALDQLTELSDRVGPRLTGSPGYSKAVEWATAQLKAAGVQNVHVEKVPMAHGWLRGTSRARALSPAARTLHVESYGWVQSTPAGGVKGPVIVLKSFDQPPPAAVKGKIVLVTLFSGHDGPPGKHWVAIKKTMAALANAGAVAVLSEMTAATSSNVVKTTSLSDRGELAPLPIAGLGREDGEWIRRQLEHGEVKVELELTNRVTGRVDVDNVVGELKGATAQWLLVGAHLDSWDFATGTQDNGAGVIHVLQAAKALAASGTLKRTVRFALWAGEEQGENGSRAYALAHEAELASCVAVLNTDNGAGHVQGWKVGGRKDTQAAFEPLANSLLAGLGGAKVDLELTSDTDHFPFFAAGVPTLDLLVEMKDYWAAHHKPGDTIDKVDPHDLATGAAVVAVTAYALASSSDPFAPILDRPALVELAKEGGFDEELRFLGWWK